MLAHQDARRSFCLRPEVALNILHPDHVVLKDALSGCLMVGFMAHGDTQWTIVCGYCSSSVLPPKATSSWIICSILFLGLSPGTGRTQASDQTRASLPWEMITQVLNPDAFRQGGEARRQSRTLAFVLGGDSAERTRNYVFAPNHDLRLDLPVGSLTQELPRQVPAQIARWTGTSWKMQGRVLAEVHPDGIVTNGGTAREGFYRLILVPETGSEKRVSQEVFFLVAANWKPDLLAYCRHAREEIELEPDPELVRSSVAISYWDHVLELVAVTPALSEEALGTLRQALQAREVFRAGGCPDLVLGLTKLRFKRFPGARVEEFTVAVPDTYEPAQKWPVYLHVDNQRWAVNDKFQKRSGLIDVWWHTVADKEIDWKVYLALWDLLRSKLSVDEDRVYVTGECRHAMAAMSLALTHPDQWAECSLSLANTYRHLAGNALNLPVVYARGNYRNEDWATGSYDFAAKCFRYFGCEHLVLSNAPDVDQARGFAVPKAVRVRRPSHVVLRIESLAHGQAYWVRIDGREDENSLGGLDVRVVDHQVQVQTRNVDAYTLFLAEAPLTAGPEVEIVEDGTPLTRTREPVFVRRSPKYQGAQTIKNQQLHGPIGDVFLDPYVVLWGTDAKERTIQDLHKDIAATLARGAPCLEDIAAPREFIRTHNIVLVGTPAPGHWSAQIVDGLSLTVSQAKIVISNKAYEGRDLGIITIRPNPLNPHRYAVVFTGTSTTALRHLLTAYQQLPLLRPADVALFQVDAKGDLHWQVFEAFNTLWNWHDAWDQVLLQVNKKHPEWQWRQWVAEVLCRQYGTDVALCENPLWFNGSVPAGAVTVRQAANIFRDYWLVKVQISGKELRQLLVAPVTNATKQAVDRPAVAGIRLSAAPSQGRNDGLTIGQLENDRKYSLVCNYKCLNGTRMGQLVKDYEIVDDGYLMTALRDYLSHADTSRDIDAQLDAVKINIF